MSRSRGRNGVGVIRLALDTGATLTVRSVALLLALGYDPAVSATRRQVTTGSGVGYVPEVVVCRLGALGEAARSIAGFSHAPPSSSVDGLLGLDFIRGYKLSIKLKLAWIALS